MNLNFKKIFIEESVLACSLTKEILKKISKLPIEIVTKNKEFVLKNRFTEENQQKDKLYLARNKGSFLKKCPATKEYICCDYYILNLYSNCNLECSYCILQSYLGSSLITIYVNIEDMFNEIDEFLKLNPRRLYRMGTGELGDSLSLDNLTGYSKKLVNFFSNKNNAYLELKTKSDNIEKLINLKHNHKTFISWSVNSKEVIKKEEKGTVPLKKRLLAAKRCQEMGYMVGLHFDPIVHYDGWEEGYKKTVDLIYEHLNKDKIIWISLGTFRFPPDLKPVIKLRFPESKILTGELIPGIDGKMRYFKGIRKNIYEKIISFIKKHDEKAFIYFCMESKQIWKNSLGFAPKDNEDLDLMFSKRILETILTQKQQLKLQ